MTVDSKEDALDFSSVIQFFFFPMQLLLVCDGDSAERVEFPSRP